MTPAPELSYEINLEIQKEKCQQYKMCKTETGRYKDSTKSIGNTERENVIKIK